MTSLTSTQFRDVIVAMMDESDWLKWVDDGIDSLPEAFEWEESEYDEERVAYVEDRLDREFWARGNW